MSNRAGRLAAFLIAAACIVSLIATARADSLFQLDRDPFERTLSNCGWSQLEGRVQSGGVWIENASFYYVLLYADDPSQIDATIEVATHEGIKEGGYNDKSWSSRDDDWGGHGIWLSHNGGPAQIRLKRDTAPDRYVLEVIRLLGCRWPEISVEADPDLPAPQPDKVTLTLSGQGQVYRPASLTAGNYVCSVSVTGNSSRLSNYGDQTIPSQFSVDSYAADGSRGGSHASEIAASWSGSSRLVVGSGSHAQLPAGEVYFEVKATSSAQWSITCE